MNNPFLNFFDLLTHTHTHTKTRSFSSRLRSTSSSFLRPAQRFNNDGHTIIVDYDDDDDDDAFNGRYVGVSASAETSLGKHKTARYVSNNANSANSFN